MVVSFYTKRAANLMYTNVLGVQIKLYVVQYVLWTHRVHHAYRSRKRSRKELDFIAKNSEFGTTKVNGLRKFRYSVFRPHTGTIPTTKNVFIDSDPNRPISLYTTSNTVWVTLGKPKRYQWKLVNLSLQGDRVHMLRIQQLVCHFQITKTTLSRIVG